MCAKISLARVCAVVLLPCLVSGVDFSATDGSLEREQDRSSVGQRRLIRKESVGQASFDDTESVARELALEEQQQLPPTEVELNWTQQTDACKTNSGPVPNETCKFPFRYNDVEYRSCTTVHHGKRWCATKLAGKDYVTDEYGFCDDSCPKPWFVAVTSNDHASGLENSSNGLYFNFRWPEEEKNLTSGETKKLDVRQCRAGQTVWSGVVRLNAGAPGGSGDVNAHGRKDTDWHIGSWLPKDYITTEPSCRGPWTALVTSINSSSDGAYFHFQWPAALPSRATYSVEATQCRNRTKIWRGLVRLHDRTNSRGESHGLRANGSQAQQWQAGDLLTTDSDCKQAVVSLGRIGSRRQDGWWGQSCGQVAGTDFSWTCPKGAFIESLVLKEDGLLRQVKSAVCSDGTRTDVGYGTDSGRVVQMNSGTGFTSYDATCSGKVHKICLPSKGACHGGQGQGGTVITHQCPESARISGFMGMYEDYINELMFFCACPAGTIWTETGSCAVDPEIPS